MQTFKKLIKFLAYYPPAYYGVKVDLFFLIIHYNLNYVHLEYVLVGNVKRVHSFQSRFGRMPKTICLYV